MTLSQMRILATSFSSGILLILVLCLGSQNLSDRLSLKIGEAKTAELPSGFLVGISLVLGVISGGSVAALLLPTSKQ